MALQSFYLTVFLCILEIDSEKSKTAPNGKENLAKAHTVTASLSDVPPVIRNLPDVGDGKNSPCTSSQMSDDTAFVDVLHKNKLEDESQSVSKWGLFLKMSLTLKKEIKIRRL